MNALFIKKKKYKVFTILIVILSICLLYFIKGRNSGHTEYINLQMLLLDKSDNIITETIKLGQNSSLFENDLTIALDSNIETNYDVILLNNYNQTCFSINNLEYKDVHHIKFNKTDGLVRRKFKLSFAGLHEGLNDCILIFDRIDNEGKFADSKVYTVRFTIQVGNNETTEAKEFFNYDVKENCLYKESNEISFDRDIMLLDSNFNPLSKNQKPKYLMINFMSEIFQTDSRRDYLENKIKNETIKIIVFAVSKNHLIDITESGTMNILTTINDRYIVELDDELPTNDMDDIKFFAVAYPFESQNNKLGSYEIILWQAILYTDPKEYR